MITYTHSNSRDINFEKFHQRHSNKSTWNALGAKSADSSKHGESDLIDGRNLKPFRMQIWMFVL